MSGKILGFNFNSSYDGIEFSERDKSPNEEKELAKKSLEKILKIVNILKKEGKLNINQQSNTIGQATIVKNRYVTKSNTMWNKICDSVSNFFGMKSAHQEKIEKLDTLIDEINTIFSNHNIENTSRGVDQKALQKNAAVKEIPKPLTNNDMGKESVTEKVAKQPSSEVEEDSTKVENFIELEQTDWEQVSSQIIRTPKEKYETLTPKSKSNANNITEAKKLSEELQKKIDAKKKRLEKYNSRPPIAQNSLSHAQPTPITDVQQDTLPWHEVTEDNSSFVPTESKNGNGQNQLVKASKTIVLTNSQIKDMTEKLVTHLNSNNIAFDAFEKRVTENKGVIYLPDGTSLKIPDEVLQKQLKVIKEKVQLALPSNEKNMLEDTPQQIEQFLLQVKNTITSPQEKTTTSIELEQTDWEEVSNHVIRVHKEKTSSNSEKVQEEVKRDDKNSSNNNPEVTVPKKSSDEQKVVKDPVKSDDTEWKQVTNKTKKHHKQKNFKKADHAFPYVNLKTNELLNPPSVKNSPKQEDNDNENLQQTIVNKTSQATLVDMDVAIAKDLADSLQGIGSAVKDATSYILNTMKNAFTNKKVENKATFEQREEDFRETFNEEELMEKAAKDYRPNMENLNSLSKEQIKDFMGS